MDKGIILYQSRYGATKKYAKWLEAKTGYACMETKKAKLSDVSGYETIVLMGGVYASGVAGLSFLKKNIASLQGKKLAVFAVGASPYDEKALNQSRQMHFQGAMEKVPLFYGRGMWDFAAMSLPHKALCSLLKKAVAKQKQEEYEPWQEALMSAGDEKCDWTDESYLEPLMKYLAE